MAVVFNPCYSAFESHSDGECGQRALLSYGDSTCASWHRRLAPSCNLVGGPCTAIAECDGGYDEDPLKNLFDYAIEILIFVATVAPRGC